jgi:hypothetical protein
MGMQRVARNIGSMHYSSSDSLPLSDIGKQEPQANAAFVGRSDVLLIALGW